MSSVSDIISSARLRRNYKLQTDTYCVAFEQEIVPALHEEPNKENVWGIGDRDPDIIIFGIWQRSVVSFTPRKLYS
jgi:hypothetical protein